MLSACRRTSPTANNSLLGYGRSRRNRTVIHLDAPPATGSCVPTEVQATDKKPLELTADGVVAEITVALLMKEYHCVISYFG